VAVALSVAGGAAARQRASAAISWPQGGGLREGLRINLFAAGAGNGSQGVCGSKGKHTDDVTCLPVPPFF
jgi:hypothetical protein